MNSFAFISVSCWCYNNDNVSVILLRIVMVSPGTHLVANHESQSRTNETQLKRNESKIENALAYM